MWLISLHVLTHALVLNHLTGIVLLRLKRDHGVLLGHFLPSVNSVWSLLLVRMSLVLFLFRRILCKGVLPVYRLVTVHHLVGIFRARLVNLLCLRELPLYFTTQLCYKNLVWKG